MKVIIVGHGPSLVGKGMGSAIDSYDLVVRLKGVNSVMGTDDYGHRCDVLCLSTEVSTLGHTMKPEMFWFYPKKGHYDTCVIGKFAGDVGIPIIVPLELIKGWNKQFLDLGGKHPNVSTGMAAIIIAGHHLRPEKITLAGFDTLVDPKVPFTRNDAIPRTGAGVITHDWETENLLLKQVSEYFGFTVAVL